MSEIDSIIDDLVNGPSDWSKDFVAKSYGKRDRLLGQSYGGHAASTSIGIGYIDIDPAIVDAFAKAFNKVTEVVKDIAATFSDWDLVWEILTEEQRSDNRALLARHRQRRHK